MGTTVVADDTEKEAIQKYVSREARLDATYDGGLFTFTHSTPFDAEWAAAKASMDASEPIPSDLSIWGGIGGTLSSQTDLQAELDSSGQTAEWGSITGVFTSQTDLISEFNSKANQSHTHVAADVTDLTTEVDAAVAAYLVANPPSGGQTHRIAQIRNSAATANLNSSTAWTTRQITGIEDYMDNPDFSAGTNGIVCNFTGRCKITAHIGYTVAGSRVNVLVRAAIGGVGQGIEGKSGYVRNASGHTEASATAIITADVTSGQEVVLQTQRESSAATSTPGDAGGCMIMIERWA